MCLPIVGSHLCTWWYRRRCLVAPPYLFNCERTHPIQLATYEPLRRRCHQCLQPLLALHQANTFVCKGKAKVCHTPRRVWEGCSSPFLRPWARRWINHWSLWRMVSATPDLWLPSQSQGIAAAWPVPNYTAWWQRQMCVNNLPKVVNWQRKTGSRTCDLQSRKSDVLTTTPPGHTHACIKSLIIRYLRDLNVYQRTEIVHTDGRACCVAEWVSFLWSFMTCSVRDVMITDSFLYSALACKSETHVTHLHW